jgi:hypothetical protein
VELENKDVELLEKSRHLKDLQQERERERERESARVRAREREREKERVY